MRIVINGKDLDYLKKLVAQTKLDEISELRMSITRDGKVSLGANNQVSEEFGHKV